MIRWVAAHGWEVLPANGGLKLRRKGVDSFISLASETAQEVFGAVNGSQGADLLSPRGRAVLTKLDQRAVLAAEMVSNHQVLARHEPGHRGVRTKLEARWSPPARVLPATYLRCGPDGPELGGSASGDRVLLTSVWAAECAARLIARADFAPAEALEAEFLDLVSRAGLLIDEDRDSALGDWEFHDALFHAATRLDTSSGPYGARQALGVGPPRAAVPRPAIRDRIPLKNLAGTSLGLRLQDALSLRQTIRDHGGDPIGQAELSAVLGGSLGVRRLTDTTTGQLAWRYFPTGGARSGLSAVVLAGHTCDLARGAYEYDAVSHELAPASGPAPAIERWFALAERLTGIETGTIQSLVLFTLDYSRPAHAYNSIVYATALKEVGAALQTMALLSVDLGLSFCPMGGGFSTTAGLGGGIRHAAVVGEAVLGRPGEPLHGDHRD